MMRHFTMGGVLLIAALGFAAESRAGTVTQFSSFWALGDSLTDDGNLYAATGGLTPGAPYYEGRFSNGPVWAEHVAGDFTARGLNTGNFAYGGARVGPNDPPVQNLGAQVGAFASASAGKLGARPVASLWFGANDLISVGIPTGTAKRVGRAAANGVAAGALALGGLGVRDVVLFNLPSLDKVPLYNLIDPASAAQARKGTRAFNATLARRADDLREAGLNVIEIDVFALFNELLDDPQKFGVADAENPCYVPGVVYCGEELAPLLAFFDPIHPNSVIHSAIADVVRAEVAPVPLPAPVLLLLVGIAGLAVAGRRRAITRDRRVSL